MTVNKVSSSYLTICFHDEKELQRKLPGAILLNHTARTHLILEGEWKHTLMNRQRKMVSILLKCNLAGWGIIPGGNFKTGK